MCRDAYGYRHLSLSELTQIRDGINELIRAKTAAGAIPDERGAPPEPRHAKMADQPAKKCPLDTPHGEIVCRGGVLWALSHSEMGPPDQRQAIGDCHFCKRRKIVK